MTERFERAWIFEEALRDRCADRLEAARSGTAVFTSSLPRVWDLNMLRVEHDEGLRAAELAAEAERVQGSAGLGHRRVYVPVEGLGARLSPGFRELGWKEDRFLLMECLQAAGDLRAPEHASEVDHGAIVPLRTHEQHTLGAERDAETIEQLLDWGGRRAEAGRARHFAAFAAGEPVACADLYSNGVTAQIEDVYTRPDHRGRGLASAIVLRAAEEARGAGHDLIFLVADYDDWPKELYRRLGFAPLGQMHAFLMAP